MLNTIYIIKNKINSKIYIGQTWQSLKDRWDSGHGYKNSRHLNRAINKYGVDQFYYEVITFCSTQEAADQIEIDLIKKYNSIKNGYNLLLGGSKGKHSDETKARMKLRPNHWKGRKHSAETIMKMKGHPNRYLGKNV